MRINIKTEFVDKSDDFEKKFLNEFNRIAIGILSDARRYASC